MKALLWKHGLSIVGKAGAIFAQQIGAGRAKIRRATALATSRRRLSSVKILMAGRFCCPPERPSAILSVCAGAAPVLSISAAVHGLHHCKQKHPPLRIARAAPGAEISFSRLFAVSTRPLCMAAIQTGRLVQAA